MFCCVLKVLGSVEQWQPRTCTAPSDRANWILCPHRQRMCGSHHVYADTLFKARRSPAFAVVLWLPAEGGNWNCLRTKFSLCTNFILQKLLVQMVNNSSLAVSGDRAHLNFLYLSNLYNAHKFKKVPTHCTIDGAKVGLKGQRAAAGSVCTVRGTLKEYF